MEAWKDFYPKNEREEAETPSERIDLFVETAGHNLRALEKAKLEFSLEKNVHRAYYHSWIEDANGLFQRMVILLHRKQAILAAEAELAGEGVSEAAEHQEVESGAEAAQDSSDANEGAVVPQGENA